MTENTKPKAPRKPRVKKEEVVKAGIGSLEATVNFSEEEIAEQVEKPLVNDETLNELTNMKDLEASLTESIVANSEIAEKQETPEEIAENKDEIAKSEDEIAGELAEADVNFVTAEEEIAAMKKEFPEAKLPEGAETFEEFTQKLDETKANTPAVVCKLNPYLEDGQSKWVAQVRANGLIHKIFKGSLPKACNAAKNYNIMHGMANAEIKKVRNLK